MGIIGGGGAAAEEDKPSPWSLWSSRWLIGTVGAARNDLVMMSAISKPAANGRARAGRI